MNDFPKAECYDRFKLTSKSCLELLAYLIRRSCMHMYVVEVKKLQGEDLQHSGSLGCQFKLIH